MALAVPPSIFIIYERPGIISRSFIQIILTLNWSDNSAGAPASTIISPREASTSSFSVITIDAPSSACLKVPSIEVISSMTVSTPDGSILTLLPGATLPEATGLHSPYNLDLGAKHIVWEGEGVPCQLRYF